MDSKLSNPVDMTVSLPTMKTTLSPLFSYFTSSELEPDFSPNSAAILFSPELSKKLRPYTQLR